MTKVWSFIDISTIVVYGPFVMHAWSIVGIFNFTMANAR